MAMARHAFESTPFYRRRYTEAGFTARDFDVPHHFDELPLIEKRELREFRDEFLSESIPASRRLVSTTGGSTGEPLRVFHDSYAPVAAMWWRAFRWWGIHPSENRAIVQRERRSPATRRREALEWWPTKVLSLDATTMNAASMEQFRGEWNLAKPALLSGYIGAAHEYAAFVADTGREFVSPRAVAVTAAPITSSQRRYIEASLGAPVFDSYRTAEVPWMAAECQAHSGLHVLADARIVEVIDDDGSPSLPGTEGTVVVSDLCNEVFPLIRYNIGDRTSVNTEPCECGRTLPRIAGVGGRIIDVLRTPNGRSVTGGLGGLFNDRPDAVTQFQVHQHADYAITLRCVPGTGSDALEFIESVAARLRSMVANLVPVSVEIVSNIPHDRGKFRLVRSDLDQGTVIQ